MLKTVILSAEVAQKTHVWTQARKNVVPNQKMHIEVNTNHGRLPTTS